MKIDVEKLSEFESLSSMQKGVFSIADLKIFFGTNDEVALQRKLKPYSESGIMRRFCRGFYVARKFNPYVLSQKINSESAVSLGTVLAQNLVIGTVPEKTVYAIKVGRTRIYESYELRIIHLGLTSSKIYFGYNFIDGIRFCDKEKAFLDTLYYYQRGYRFSFDVYDMNVDLLDIKKVNRYLKMYGNPKFVKFAKGVLNG